MSDDYNIKKETLLKWLKNLYEISESSQSLENAIEFAKMFATGEDVEVSNTIAVLYRAERSGDIDPPIKMRELYAKIVQDNMSEDERIAG